MSRHVAQSQDNDNNIQMQAIFFAINSVEYIQTIKSMWGRYQKNINQSIKSMWGRYKKNIKKRNCIY